MTLFSLTEKKQAADQHFDNARLARGVTRLRWNRLNSAFHQRLGDGGVYALVGLAGGVGMATPRRSLSSAVHDLESSVDELRDEIQSGRPSAGEAEGTPHTKGESKEGEDEGDEVELHRVAISFLSKLAVGAVSRAVFTSVEGQSAAGEDLAPN